MLFLFHVDGVIGVVVGVDTDVDVYVDSVDSFCC